jgi:hypothetical protein
MKEQPITRAGAEALVSQITLAIDSGAEHAAVDFMGTELVVEKDPDGAYTVRAAGQSDSARFYLPAAERPAAYPSSAPFVPNEALMVSGSEQGELTMIWWAPREPETLLATLEKSLSTDWVLQPGPELASNALQRSYGREGLNRRLFMAEGIVTLMQRNASSPA